MKYKYAVLFGKDGNVRFVNMQTQIIVIATGTLLASKPEIICTEEIVKLKDSLSPFFNVYKSTNIFLESDQNVD